MSAHPTDPSRLADAIDAALARLAASLRGLDDVDACSRAADRTRRQVVVRLASRLDAAARALAGRGVAGGAAVGGTGGGGKDDASDPAPDRDGIEGASREAAALADGDGGALAAAIEVLRRRVAEGVQHALAIGTGGCGSGSEALVDELDALLARVELGHVSLDAGYDLADLPATSLVACARVSRAFERLRPSVALGGGIRPSARRERGIRWPRGRRST
ncbi:hypothetical protein [Agrococcus versicolor]|uniref:hypothetical protein n=1 Tax=Agrococcus versicolor TaxID=501482 RepID=UPI0031E3C081